MYHLSCTQNANFSWLTFVKGVFDECGLSYIWNSQNFINDKWLKEKIKQCLSDQFQQSWNNDLQTCPKAINYRIFKDSFGFENYLNILEEKNLFIFSKFRMVNHALPIERGRWQNIERENRSCTLCLSDIGDEYHYILKCPFFSEERKLYLRKRFYKRPNIMGFKEIMSSSNKQILINLCKFIKTINKGVSPPD